MWDWTSFVSGLLGAFLGAAASLTVTLLTRADSRRERRHGAIEDVVAAVAKLAVDLTAHPVGAGGVPIEAGGAFAEVHRATLRLEPFLKADDRVIEWVIQYVGQNVLFPTSRVARISASGIVGQRLMNWHLGRQPLNWFAKDLARLEDSDSAADKT